MKLNKHQSSTLRDPTKVEILKHSPKGTNVARKSIEISTADLEFMPFISSQDMRQSGFDMYSPMPICKRPAMIQIGCREMVAQSPKRITIAPTKLSIKI